MSPTPATLREGAASRGDLREHPRVADALAPAVLHALLDDAAMGIALVRGDDFTHLLASATYERLVGVKDLLGRDLWSGIPAAVVTRAMLASVLATGRGAHAEAVLVRREGERGASIHVALTLLFVPGVAPEVGGVLVLAEDVSQHVHDRRTGVLFAAIANEFTSATDESASIRASVAQTAEALGADAASLFLLSADGKSLEGALVGWDWTRTSFAAEVEQWPGVARAVEANEPVYVTLASARLAEETWFERRGIKAAICAPMAANGRVLGVLFFDYTSTSAKVDLAMAKAVADRCARLVARAAERLEGGGANDAPGVRR